MRRSTSVTLVCGLFLLSSLPAAAQSTPNPAMTTPDQVAWQFFIQVNSRASGSNALFETWASDTDTFKPTPQFPTTATPMALREPVVPALGRQALQRGGRLLPAIPPGRGFLEESRRNKESFDFIVQNNLFKVSGLRAAFGKTIVFPVAAMEVKANWKLVTDIPAFSGGRVTLADVPNIYHVNTGSDGKQYAFVSMHIISKAVPNWTWATFEHKFNPARCDIIGCRDSFGAQTSPVKPNSSAEQGYPDCAKTAPLNAMLAAANIDPVFANYCLKGSQTDFTDDTGLDIRLGNSVTEDGFVPQSSCITCHGRAAWDNTGSATSQAGFDDNGAPLGPIQPNWYFSFAGQPPIFEGMPGLTQVATSADFVWSIPFCAIDDTQIRYPEVVAPENEMGRTTGMIGSKIALAGSNRAEPEGAVLIGDVDPDERIVVSLHLKRRSPDKFQPGSAGDLARLSQPITRHALVAQRKRTHARAAARIRKFATANGLAVRGVDLTARVVMLEASARQMGQIFGARLCIYDNGQRRFRARIGQLMIPTAIAPWTRAILGFDQRPLTARPVNRLLPLAGAGAGTGLWPTEIAALYDIPLDRDVSSVCVGIIALGGGYLPADLAKALTGMRLQDRAVIDQSVSGGGNNFGGGTQADQEVALDLQIIASLLPKARIVVYFAPNTIQSLVAAINQAVFDDVHRPQVLSVSWGSAETFWTDPGRDAMQAVLADAMRLRVSVVFAAGDQLATAGVTDGAAHVWFPASSPYALGCGGTLPTLGSDGAVTAEAVWNDGFDGTGGGISDVFPVPAYQSKLALPASVNDGAVRRGVPDVAGLAAGTPGYRVVVNGAETVKDGTSAVAPLWAALIAIANAQRSTPLGFLNSALYSNPSLFRPITQGNNRDGGKGYDAGPGWNACTGLGVPKGADLIAALAATPVS